ncbi:MAG: glycosyltransferase 87 family protein [Candidatus Shapirobacteria bacterium]|nr:glycosyltransferase 87 family protein [Candidatus Shapirobacteria bacterium]MDD4410569.1 glycosyltransferase 87 family protein [Candidatus Shapirobacteria bacterium]
MVISKKVFLGLFVVAFLLRIGLAISTYHSDIGSFAMAGKYIVGEGKVLGFFDAVTTRGTKGELKLFGDQIVFNYQPLAYLIPSAIYLPFRPIIINTASQLVNTNWTALHQKSIYWPLLIYKLPMILADLAIVLLLPKLFEDKKKKILAQILWLFNPIAIYVSSMMGQVDIIIALFLLLALINLKNKRNYKAVVWVALSALIKPAGLILIPIVAINEFHKKNNWFDLIKTAFLGCLVYGLGVASYIWSPAYRYFSLFAEQIGKSTFAGIAVASGTVIPWFFIAFIFGLFLFWKKKINIETIFGLSLITSLVFTHFHPQWLVWIMPWMIYESIRKEEIVLYLGMIAAWLGIVFSFDSTLHIDMFLARGMVTATTFSGNLISEITMLSRAYLVAITGYKFIEKKEN